MGSEGAPLDEALILRAVLLIQANELYDPVVASFFIQMRDDRRIVEYLINDVSYGRLLLGETHTERRRRTRMAFSYFCNSTRAPAVSVTPAVYVLGEGRVTWDQEGNPTLAPNAVFAIMQSSIRSQGWSKHYVEERSAGTSRRYVSDTAASIYAALGSVLGESLV